MSALALTFFFHLNTHKVCYLNIDKHSEKRLHAKCWSFISFYFVSSKAWMLINGRDRKPEIKHLGETRMKIDLDHAGSDIHDKEENKA
ncbi:hypothetical protein OIU78_004134 [Salix suchowensis]|nr:hypothetical protein OIU78_004134 [Salix suchowensis]